jgi:hypothetical protein
MMISKQINNHKLLVVLIKIKNIINNKIIVNRLKQIIVKHLY